MVENGVVHPERLASHLATWFATRRVNGIGASTQKAMRGLVAGVLVFLPITRDISPESPEATKSSELLNVSRIF
jgi:hypothetical protein